MEYGILPKVFKMAYNLERREYLPEERESAIIISERFRTLLSYGTVLGILDIFCTLLVNRQLCPYIATGKVGISIRYVLVHVC